MLTASERFWSKVDQSGECWEWQAGLNRTGYGQFWFEGQMVLAHRFALTLTDGPMPEDQLVCHHCDNRKCVRPDHLYLGDASDNQRDAVARGRHASQKKTHCPNGHEYTPENTMLDRGNRRCRTCRNRKDKEYRQQRKDFQAALAAADAAGYERGLRERWGVREDRAWSAALLTVARFWEKVDATGDCWNWTAGKDGNGYGYLNISGKQVGAHRFSWEMHKGPIPDGLWVLHRCDNPSCVKPSHLFIGTVADNTADMNAKGRNGYASRTHCAQGHPYDEENTRYYRGRRNCRACDRERAQRERDARKEAKA